MSFAHFDFVADTFLQTTSKFAPKGLQDLITISEFPHSWGQNTIVSALQCPYLQYLNISVDCSHQWVFAEG